MPQNIRYIDMTKPSQPFLVVVEIVVSGSTVAAGTVAFNAETAVLQVECVVGEVTDVCSENFRCHYSSIAP